MTKQKIKIPKTAEFCGRKRSVKQASNGISINDYEIVLSKDHSIYLEVWENDDDTDFIAEFEDMIHDGKTLEGALKKLEKETLKWFKGLGAALNYDVE